MDTACEGPAEELMIKGSWGGCFDTKKVCSSALVLLLALNVPCRGFQFHSHYCRQKEKIARKFDEILGLLELFLATRMFAAPKYCPRKVFSQNCPWRTLYGKYFFETKYISRVFRLKVLKLYPSTSIEDNVTVLCVVKKTDFC